jgi:large subunit ribosomal protein L21
MYAIIKSGGKQYKVSPGDILSVEKIEGNVGDSVVLTDVLMVYDEQKTEIGRPLLNTATVSGEIVGQGKKAKAIIFKSRRRKHYQKKTGHRQPVTRIKIKEIQL